MFRFQPNRFSGGQEPWFRLGTLEVGSAGIVSLVVAVSIFLWAIEGPSHAISSLLWLEPLEVRSGQIWRLLTWWMPNQPSLGAIISVVIIFYFGSQLEGALGRIRMAQFLGILVIVPAITSVLVSYTGMVGAVDPLIGARLLNTALLVAFVAYLPSVRFFFGIPGWVLVSVFVGIDILQYLSVRYYPGIIILAVMIGSTLLAAKAFGIAEEVEWIPKIATIGGEGSGYLRDSSGRSTKRRRRKGPDLSVVDPVSDDQVFEQLDIDSILDQVSAFGVDSLSAKQKKALKEYSKRKRK